MLYTEQAENLGTSGNRFTLHELCYRNQMPGNPNFWSVTGFCGKLLTF